jgi:ribosomal protein S18 acetylase RimI-like enzyme
MARLAEESQSNEDGRMITVELARPIDNAWVQILHNKEFDEITIDEYLQWISQRNRRVYVMRRYDNKVGFVFVRLNRDAATICKIAINPYFRRYGIATEAVRQITAKHGKRLTRAAAKEPDAIAQDFFRSLGMRLKLVEDKPKDRFWIFEGTNKERAKR